MFDQQIPYISPSCVPPVVLGAAALVTAAMHGASIAELSSLIEQHDADPVARLFDTAILTLIGQRRDDAMALQKAAIAASPLFRIRQAGLTDSSLRLLALVLPGDMMANTPLDFVTGSLDVQLDLLFILPGQRLPAIIPEHDLMFFAATEPDSITLGRMQAMFRTWPRPVLNDPALLPALSRDRLAALLAQVPAIRSPRAIEISRGSLQDLHGDCALPTGWAYPVLVRPLGSHAGDGLAKIDEPAALAAYLQATDETIFYLTEFVEYRDADGLYRKYRIAFIDGRPHLCHLAVSQNWMVHYLNAGMTESAEKRSDEAAAMLQFDTGFALRHEHAFAAFLAALPFDFVSIDCGELPDGRLLVFEADTAAIIHNMDSAALFPYKHAQMRRVFDAFGTMLTDRTAAGPSRRFA